MKNILLIVIDTLRPDHLGCYGYERPTSPNLDALAAAGTRLDALWSVSNFTAPAFTSLFTGLHPHHHGVFDFTAQALSSPLQGALDSSGMRTAGVVTFRFFGNLLKNIWGPIEAVTDTRGFDFSKNLPFDVTDSSLEWMDKHGREQPFCLFVHYDGPHTPFRLPDEDAAVFAEPFAGAADPAVRDLLFPRAEKLDNDRNKTSMYRFMKDVNWGRRRLDEATLRWIIAMYDAAVRYNDRAVGKLLTGLDQLGLADQTIVAVLSDHGEEFLEHGGFAHGGVHLYEEIIRTVGIIRDPDDGSREGRGVSAPASQADMLATLLKLAGAEGLPGTDLDRLLADPDHRPGPVFCHGKSKIAVRDGDTKLIAPRPNPSLDRLTRLKMWVNMALMRKLRPEIFDLASDPGETSNLYADRGLRHRMRNILREHLAAPPPGPLGGENLSAAERARIEQEMRDLGYM